MFRYKGSELTAQEIGGKLGVEAVLTGRLLQLENRLIIRTELVDVANGWQLWGAEYNRTPSDIFELQETISREISENLRLKLTSTEQSRLVKRYTDSVESYHSYIKGKYYLNKRLTETVEQATEYFRKAIDADPEGCLSDREGRGNKGTGIGSRPHYGLQLARGCETFL